MIFRCNIEKICLTSSVNKLFFGKQTCLAISKSLILHQKSINGNFCVTYCIGMNQLLSAFNDISAFVDVSQNELSLEELSASMHQQLIVFFCTLPQGIRSQSCFLRYVANCHREKERKKNEVLFLDNKKNVRFFWPRGKIHGRRRNNRCYITLLIKNALSC